MKTKLPPLPKTGERRLLKLIAFLEKLPRRKFQFSRLVTATNKEKTCGTICCAIGWTPLLFPKLAHWYRLETVDGFWAGEGLEEDILDLGRTLFGMDNKTTKCLFQPNEQKYLHEKLPLCNSDATPKQVAKMLRKYLALTKEAA